MANLSQLRLDASSSTPLYKQLAAKIEELIDRSVLTPGEKLPPTRELAGQLGLNRTTVAAAYAVLDEIGLIDGQVGRGSFVSRASKPSISAETHKAEAHKSKPDEYGAHESARALAIAPTGISVSFASARPAAADFPLEQFRQVSRQVIDSAEAADILQLGSARGFPPLRRYLLEEAVRDGAAMPGDDVLVTNGCQQGLDLIARVLAGPGTSIAVEDPVYHGLLRVFARAGGDIFGVPMDDGGIDVNALEHVLGRHRPRLLALTPSFQNPTGVTLGLDRRQRIVELAARFGCLLVEVDLYSDLRYRGASVPRLKQLDGAGNTLLLRSYSKISFPGLRVGWIVGPGRLLAPLAEAKEISDLHSDQLSQAVLLRFAESGELARHLERTRLLGAERLQTVLQSCQRFLPPGSTWTRPDGGMSLWVELPAPLTAERLLARAQRAGIDFLPGRQFASRQAHVRGLRLSFGALSSAQIAKGMEILGEAAAEESAAAFRNSDNEPAAALV